MAAIASCPREATGETTSVSILYSPPEYAQGVEGRLLDDNVATVAVRWRGPSEYVATLLTGRNESSWTNRLLAAAGVSGIGCAGLALSGLILDLGQVFFPLAGVTGLAAYIFLTRWVARQNHQSGLLRFVERVRRSIAYEGDPGSRTK